MERDDAAAEPWGPEAAEEAVAGPLRIAVEGRVSELTPGQRVLLLERRPEDESGLRTAVLDILDDVRDRGDAALLDMARRFDGVELSALEIPREAWDRALAALDPEVRRALERAARNIHRFHRAQLPGELSMEVEPGVVLGRRFVPLERVGVYAPGGRAAYPSSVLMGVVAARAAGVGEVIVCSPPSRGLPPDAVLAAAAIAGADRLFAVGGAGAVAAMAYGTATVPRCAAVVGPGNRWVLEAKRQVAGAVVIDSPAGPSEVLVVADATADPERVAQELVAQAEHDPDAAVALVTDSEALLSRVRTALARQVAAAPRRSVVAQALATRGALLLARDRGEALEFADRYAAEHLSLMTKDPEKDLERVRTAGTAFLGGGSSVAHGDYLTGANHVLPTAGASRSFSGLSTLTFLRSYTWQAISPEGGASMADDVGVLARAEGLPGHAAAARGAGEPGERSGGGEPGEQVQPRARPLEGRSHGGGPMSRFPRPDYRALGRYTPDRRPVEVDLSDNTNLWGTHPAALDVLREGSPDLLARYPLLYADELKAAVARFAGVSPDAVTTGCGSDDILDSAFRACCGPGGVVRYAGPTFSMVEPLSHMNGRDPREVPWSRALQEPELLLADDPVLVYVCRPNNPTGSLAPRPWVEALLELCETRGAAAPLVILDEAYADFADESWLAEAPRHSRLLVVRTLSKAYGLAGLRVGYAVGGTAAIAEVEKSRGPYKVSRLAEAAAVAALEDAGGWTAATVGECVANRERLGRELDLRRLDPLPSKANFILVPVAAGTASSLALAFRERGVALRPFPACPDVGDALRVTVGPWPLMERFLEALDGLRTEAPEAFP